MCRLKNYIAWASDKGRVLLVSTASDLFNYLAEGMASLLMDMNLQCMIAGGHMHFHQKYFVIMAIECHDEAHRDLVAAKLGQFTKENLDDISEVGLDEIDG